MAIDYHKDLIELNKSIYQLEDDLEKFDNDKNEFIRRDINFDINVVRLSLTNIKTKVNNYYIGGI